MLKKRRVVKFPCRSAPQKHQSYFKAEGNCQILLWDITFLAGTSVNRLSFERNAA